MKLQHHNNIDLCISAIVFGILLLLLKIHQSYASSNINDRGDHFILYGITQDCQVFFVDRRYLGKLYTIHVNPRSTYCYPNLVKLHLQYEFDQISLLLLIKRSQNHICTMPVEIPSFETIATVGIFNYSLQSSLQYATCSHLRKTNFSLHPDLSFMDTTLTNIIYFINSQSHGIHWDVRRFQISRQGTFKATERLTMTHPSRDQQTQDNPAEQFIVELDSRRSLLYTMHRTNRNVLSECSFDLLFRHSAVKPRWFELKQHRHQTKWLDSFSVDNDLMIFAESTRKQRGMASSVFILDLGTRNRIRAAFNLPYAVDISILTAGTADYLLRKHISRFGSTESRVAQTKTVFPIQFTTSSTKHKTLSPTVQPIDLYSVPTTVMITDGRSNFEKHRGEATKEDYILHSNALSPSVPAESQMGSKISLHHSKTHVADKFASSLNDLTNHRGRLSFGGTNFTSTSTRKPMNEFTADNDLFEESEAESEIEAAEINGVQPKWSGNDSNVETSNSYSREAYEEEKEEEEKKIGYIMEKGSEEKSDGVLLNSAEDEEQSFGAEEYLDENEDIESEHHLRNLPTSANARVTEDIITSTTHRTQSEVIPHDRGDRKNMRGHSECFSLQFSVLTISFIINLFP
ncbi:hypothetical protein AB6A40_001062 [Gnathostoma spinigerum]|uniref:Uncharacterized protein n=1 Tax=Gnathostoma spinigerum TaxID=75299 RepID=A0ABD6EC27_9BILA